MTTQEYDENEDLDSRNESSMTRDKAHPDGFSFLQSPPGIFWTTWLEFTSEELGRLAFMRWRYERDKLGEYDEAEVPAEPLPLL